MIKFIRALLLVLQMGPEKVLRLREESRTDPLTGLLNRRGFQERMTNEKARSDRYGHGFLVVYLDMDNLKVLNDTLGYHEGDRALKKLAQKIQGIIRSTDFAGRLGGDEFAIVFVETETTEGILKRLTTEVTGASIGHYHYRGDASVLVDDIISSAERSMKTNKKSRKAGRD